MPEETLPELPEEVHDALEVFESHAGNTDNRRALVLAIRRALALGTPLQRAALRFLVATDPFFDSDPFHDSPHHNRETCKHCAYVREGDAARREWEALRPEVREYMKRAKLRPETGGKRAW